MDYLFDYLQVFTWPDGETLPGAGEIPDDELTPENIAVHVPPTIVLTSAVVSVPTASMILIDGLPSDTFITVYISAIAPVSPSINDLWVDTDDGIVYIYTAGGWVEFTGGVSAEINIVTHVPPGVVLTSECLVESDGTLIILHPAPIIDLSASASAGVITFVLHVPPEIVLDTVPGQAMAVALHVLPEIALTSSPAVEYEGVLIIQHVPPEIALSMPTIGASLGKAPTWYTGQVAFHVPPEIAFTMRANVVGSIISHVPPGILITAAGAVDFIEAELPIATVYRCN